MVKKSKSAKKSKLLQNQNNVINFSLKDLNNKLWNLKDFSGKKIVLYFYPKDDTPGCTLEAKEFNNLKEKFEENNSIVIGISGGDSKSKEKFCDRNNLSILLLSDSDFKVSKSYGVYGEKSFMGKKFMGIKRTTFIINETGKIIEIFENVKPSGHANKVLEIVEKI